MRYVLATCLICAIGLPAAAVTPKMSSAAALIGKAEIAVEPVKHKVEPVKHKRAPVKHKGLRDTRTRSLGGIHPLVGSGDY